ncbi:MAG: hypothetical protein DCC46_00490 [Armatimonadetes bacterium]|nr:MAG: hypothetical protein DCC46_00490 [Armatimonadota bacterium]
MEIPKTPLFDAGILRPCVPNNPIDIRFPRKYRANGVRRGLIHYSEDEVPDFVWIIEFSNGEARTHRIPKK